MVIRRIGHDDEALGFGGFRTLNTEIVGVDDLGDKACRVYFGGYRGEEVDAERDVGVGEVEGGKTSVSERVGRWAVGVSGSRQRGMLWEYKVEGEIVRSDRRGTYKADAAINAVADDSSNVLLWSK